MHLGRILILMVEWLPLAKASFLWKPLWRFIEYFLRAQPFSLEFFCRKHITKNCQSFCNSRYDENRRFWTVHPIPAVCTIVPWQTFYSWITKIATKQNRNVQLSEDYLRIIGPLTLISSHQEGGSKFTQIQIYITKVPWPKYRFWFPRLMIFPLHQLKPNS